ncbi:MAG: hypothetical protein WD226_11560 [Planctomycetota bacterium]
MNFESTTEPRPLGGSIRFEEGDFHALEDRLAGDPQFNDRRLVTRRKLLALAKRAKADIAASTGLALDVRSSLHHPHAFNHNKVGRLWSSLFRVKAEKSRLKKTLGADLAKDLDSAHKNAGLTLSLQPDALRVAFEIGPEAWYDGQNMKKRIAAEGLEAWRQLLDELDGFRLRMHDWKGEWRCGDLSLDRLTEYLGYYVPGEHRLAVERTWPATGPARAAACSEGVADVLLAELQRLVPLYRFSAWSKESDFLFA